MDFDVLILGNGRVGRQISEACEERALKAAIVAPPTICSDDRLFQLLHIFRFGRPAEEKAPPSTCKVFSGQPRFVAPKAVEIDGQSITAKSIAIALGSVPHVPAELKSVSTVDALELVKQAMLPPSVSIVGDGPLAVALADYLLRRSVSVVLYSRTGKILPREHFFVAERIQAELQKRGAKVMSGVPSPHEKIVLCAGAEANIGSIDVHRAGIFTGQTNAVITDDDMKTSSRDVFAAGSVTGPELSLLQEEVQATIVGQNVGAPFFSRMKWEPDAIFPFHIPMAVPFARIGMNRSEEARSKKAKVVIHEDELGLIRIAAHRRTGEIFGVQLLTEGANELVMYFGLAMQAGLSVFELESEIAPPATHARILTSALQAWVNSSSSTSSHSD